MRRARGGRILASLLASLLAGACASAPANAGAGGAPGCPRTFVPERAPDTPIPREIAAGIYAPENIVHSHPRMTGPYPRDVIWVFFHDHTPRAERQAAVELVCAELIGGDAIGPGGIYILRIRHDGTADPLHAAIDRLKDLPAIRTVTPDLSLALVPAD